jgi:hypothetical protein
LSHSPGKFAVSVFMPLHPQPASLSPKPFMFGAQVPPSPPGLPLLLPVAPPLLPLELPPELAPLLPPELLLLLPPGVAPLLPPLLAPEEPPAASGMSEPDEAPADPHPTSVNAPAPIAAAKVRARVVYRAVCRFKTSLRGRRDRSARAPRGNKCTLVLSGAPRTECEAGGRSQPKTRTKVGHATWFSARPALRHAVTLLLHAFRS